MNASERRQYRVLMLLMSAATLAFGYYWFSNDTIAHNFTGYLHVFDFVLFGLLTIPVWGKHVMEMVSYVVVRKIKPDPSYVPPPEGYRVAFITTFVPSSEPIEMLRATLTSMLAVKYPHDTWVLDEGNDSSVKELCREIGVHYFTRGGNDSLNTEHGHRFAAKTKGGNHNAWYFQGGGFKNYDFVAQIDTDFTEISPMFLHKTLARFSDPKVAFVGTPQVYGNTEESWIAKGAAQQTFLFYGALMRGFGGRMMTLLIGANHVVRVDALRQVHGYDAHLAEDMATGMKFHSNGWKSAYVREVLAVGEGPSTWHAYFAQQARWSFSCMSLLFHKTPRLVRTMGLAQAGLYVMLQQFYFNGINLAISISLLTTYFFTGWTPANLQLVDLVIWYVPVLVLRQIFVLWSQRFNARPDVEKGFLMAGRFITIAAIPIYFLSFVGVLRGVRLTFKTTPKGEGDGFYKESIWAFGPHMILAATTALGAMYGVLLGNVAWAFIAWAVVNTSLLFLFPGILLWYNYRKSGAAARHRTQVSLLASKLKVWSPDTEKVKEMT